ncbi:DUF3048 domain-containing protein [Neobacillus piezotolerans]|uniref:DUF3048 domain-containing protein n=1 Tax=Neobacillus piezotolerans TaxID=2259171 RepID=A0A3D8GQ35_9BACI|nr:DUF3048 domain-containing protein [Neobacillus piezotolerans]RDU36604.1 DUF3048 domain-containing protein [Neobacillus piezotolerans]
MRKWSLAVAATLLLLSACSDKEVPKESAKPTKKAAAAEKVEHSVPDFPFAYPLTGIGSQTESVDRAFAVVVNNFPKARPQSGLHMADIVYELLAEGEVTRFLAVYQSEKPEIIGPVRSARDYYINVAKGLDSIFIAHGYSVEAKKMLNSGYIDNLNGMAYDGTLFKRASFRKAPHNSYISYENMMKGAKKNGFKLEPAPRPFKFLSEKEVEKIEGRIALSAFVSYGTKTFSPTYKYDPAIGKYKRYINGELMVDLETKQPILLDNIFIAEMGHTPAGPGGLRDIDLKGGGKGYLFQKGKVIEVDWLNDNGRIIPIKNGNEAGLVPGKTWVNIVPSSPGLAKSVSIEES